MCCSREYISAIIDASAGVKLFGDTHNARRLRLFSFCMHISNNNKNIIRVMKHDSCIDPFLQMADSPDAHTHLHTSRNLILFSSLSTFRCFCAPNTILCFVIIVGLSCASRVSQFEFIYYIFFVLQTKRSYYLLENDASTYSRSLYSLHGVYFICKRARTQKRQRNVRESIESVYSVVEHTKCIAIAKDLFMNIV